MLFGAFPFTVLFISLRVAWVSIYMSRKKGLGHEKSSNIREWGIAEKLARGWEKWDENWESRWGYLHNGVVVMKINKVIHLINIIKLSVCTWWNFTLNLLKHFIFSTFLNEFLFTASDNIFQFPEMMVENYVLWGMLALLTLSAIFCRILLISNFFFLCVYESLDPLDEQMSFYIKYFLLLFLSINSYTRLCVNDWNE